MTKYQRAASKTVIIHPGSVLLRIGLAVDEEPKAFLHCIARTSKTPSPGRIPLPKSTPYDHQFESDNSNRFCDLENVKPTENDKKLYKILNSSISNTKKQSDDTKPTFLPFLKGVRESSRGNYELQWPIVSGHFNDAFPASLNLQNMEDMWTYALENYVCLYEKHVHSIVYFLNNSCVCFSLIFQRLRFILTRLSS